MRIRRRPQQPSPYTAALLHHQQYRADPSTSAQQTPRNAEERGPGGGGDEEEGRPRPPHLHANADLGRKPAAARRLALPQDNAVEGQGATAEQGADGAHRSNGHGGGAGWKLDVACTGAGERAVKVEDPVTNGVAAPAVLSAVKEEKNGSGGAAGGAKKRRGPAVLMEGSRCSRVNGRGWRCSQPTLVGYSLCEHHLGKGRMRSAAAAAAAGVGGGGRGGPGQLGRTEHRSRMPVGVAVTTVTGKAEEPGLRPY
ncbi:spidroin-2-like isoform X2 [Triticum dicoccoides]|uniref:spidroin-2-like isoform X2 n=1 Tax=Triticum dicoccoides TaxID=85692 RepID=UPI001891C651|nr:spidroin-2-like isoform X2 [Triticum dicoccoides]XP_044431581.1 spidroin-2-like isoform X2 [Triticum aestivum]